MNCGARAQVGSWLPPFKFTGNPLGCAGSSEPEYAIHSHLIPVGPHRGKVLIWSRSGNSLCYLQYLATAPGDYDQQFAIVDADANPPTVTYGVWRIPAVFAPQIYAGSVTIPGIATVTHGVQGLFCSGHCWLPDGRLFVVGGNDWSAAITESYADFTGSRMVAIWDPTAGPTGTWSTAQQLPSAASFLLRPRWYPTALLTVVPAAPVRTTKVIVFGGIEQAVLEPERVDMDGNGVFLSRDRAYLTHEAYDVVQGVPTWTISKDTRPGAALPPVFVPSAPTAGLFLGPASSPPLPTFPLGYSLFYYARAHYLSNGVLGGGPSVANGVSWVGSMPVVTTWIDHPVNANTWLLPQPALPILSDILEEATAVLLPASLGGGGEDRLALIGGQFGLEHIPSNVTGKVFVLDAKLPAPTWSPTAIPPLNEVRKFHNSVLLPDSSLLVVGGGQNPTHGATGNEVFHPSVFRGTLWEDGPPEVSPRTYHSCALLLRSGNVLSIGGDSRTWDLQVYQPHYVLPGNNRPVITANPATIAYASNFTVSLTLAPGRTLAKASLTAPGSVTHSHDPNQRIVELAIVSSTSTSATMTAPANPTKAPYGHYLLWLVDSAGEVSVGAWTSL